MEVIQPQQLHNESNSKISDISLEDDLIFSNNEICFDDKDDIIVQVNSLKFPKPRNIKPNNFVSVNRPNILNDLKEMSQICDDKINMHSPFKTRINELLAQQIDSKKKRTQRKNKSSLKTVNLQKQHLEESHIASINNFRLKPGNLRLILVEINNYKCNALCDSGATTTIISQHLADELKLDRQPIKIRMTTANGASTDNCTAITRISLKLKDIRNRTLSIVTQAVICKSTNNFSIIIGSDVIYNDLKSSLTNNHWTISRKKSSIKNFKVPFLIVDNNYKAPLRLTPINNVTIKANSQQTIQLKVEEPNDINENQVLVVNHNYIDRHKLEIQESLDSIHIQGSNKTVKSVITNHSHHDIDLNSHRYISNAQIIDHNQTLNVPLKELNEFTNKFSQTQPILMSSFSTKLNSNENTEFLSNDSKTEFVNNYIKNPDKIIKNKRIVTDPNIKIEHLPRSMELPDHFAENVINKDQETIICENDSKNNKRKYFSIDKIDLRHIDDKFRATFKSIIKSNQKAFAKHEFDIGCTKLIEHHIEIKAVPPSQKQRFLPEDKLQYAKKAIQELQLANIVKICDNPLTISNLCLVPKFHGTRENTKAASLYNHADNLSGWRLAHDLRGVNFSTLNVRRLNRVCIDTFINNLAGRYVTTLDILSAYYHIPLSEKSQKLTGFYLDDKKMCFMRMSQGLISASSTFQQLWDLTFDDKILAQFKSNSLTSEERNLVPNSFKDFIQNYFDDGYLWSDTVQEHTARLKCVFHALIRADIHLNPLKCNFFVTKFKILGYELNTFDKQTYLDEFRINSILKWPRPSSLYELSSRIATLGYFQKYLPKLKLLMFPLIALLRQKTFIWDEICEKSWRMIRLLVSLQVRLTIPHPNEQLILLSDSSNISCSQNLFVVRDDNLQLVGTNSKIFNYIDSTKNAYCKEAISLVIGLKHFQTYLSAAKIKPLVLVDAKSILSLTKSKGSSLSSANISNYLAYYSQIIPFTLLHINGTYNYFSDLFSRSFVASKKIQSEIYSLKDDYYKLKSHFSLSSDELYLLLVAKLSSDKSKKRIHTKPLKNIIDIYNNLPPEKKFLSSMEFLVNGKKTIIDKHNLTDKLSETDRKRLEHFDSNNSIICFRNEVDHKTLLNEIQKIFPNANCITNIIPDCRQQFYRSDDSMQISLNKIVLSLTDQLLAFNKQAIFQNKVDPELFSQIQDNDKYLRTIRYQLKNESSDLHKLYSMNEGILYKKSQHFDKLCIPHHILKQLIHRIHTEKGHISKEKIIHFFNIYYHSNVINKYATKEVDNCFICYTLANPPKQKENSTNARFIDPTRPRQAWSFDLITNLPPTSEKYTTLLLGCDIYSKYIVAYFLEDKKTKSVTKAVLAHFANFGQAEYILTDSDQCLISSFEPLSSKLHFHYHTTPPGSQHLNHIERFWKDLKGLIQKSIYDPQNNFESRAQWPLATILAINALNSLPLKNLNYTREQILFRFENDLKLFYDENYGADLSHLDKKILQDVEYYRKNPKKIATPDKRSYFKGQIIYIKNSLPKIIGQNNAFKSFNRGPLKITQVDNERKLVTAFCSEKQKYYTAHFKDIYSFRSPFQIIPLLPSAWNSLINNEIKHSSNTSPPNTRKTHSTE